MSYNIRLEHYKSTGATNRMIIRSFQLADSSEVTVLLNEVLSETCYKDTMSAFANQLSLDSQLVLVAVENDKIVGAIIGTVDNDEGYYYRIAVDRQCQRRGIGKRLIQEMKKRFENRKVRKIMVTLDMHNEPLLPLYEKMGYAGADFSQSKRKLKILSG